MTKTNAKAAWILRTFSCREIPFMRKLWKMLLQYNMDYCNILWAPIGRIGDIRYQESPLRAFTKRCKGLYNMTYWERLKICKLSSIEGRVERYMIIYIWKVMNNLVPPLGLEWRKQNIARGGMKLDIPKIVAVSESVKTINRQSFRHHGCVCII